MAHRSYKISVEYGWRMVSVHLLVSPNEVLFLKSFVEARSS